MEIYPDSLPPGRLKPAPRQTYYPNFGSSHVAATDALAMFAYGADKWWHDRSADGYAAAGHLT